MALASGDATSLSEKTRGKWSAISQKLGCLFGKNASTPVTKNTVEEIAPQYFPETEPVPAPESDDSERKFDFVAYFAAQKKYDTSSFCPGCDLYFWVFHSDVDDWCRMHKEALTLTTQSTPSIRVDDGTYPWKIFQIKFDERDSQLSKLVDNIHRLKNYIGMFAYDHENLSQVFAAVTNTDPSEILGFIVVSQINWKLENAINFDKACVTEIVSEFVAVTYSWVHKPWRRRGIATSLAEAARKYFFSNSTIPKEKFGFVARTYEGSVFEANYFGKCRNPPVPFKHPEDEF